MADLNQSLESATRILEQLRDTLLSSPQQVMRGSSVLATAQAATAVAQTPMAQAQMQSQLVLVQRLQVARTELEVVKQQGQLAFYRNPQAQVLARAQLAATAQRDTLKTQIESEQLKTQAAWFSSPQGRAATGAQAGAGRERDTLAMQADIARMRAEAAQLRTPAGRAQVEAQQFARREQRAAQEELRQAQNPQSNMEQFQSGIMDAARGLKSFAGGFKMVEAAILGFASVASPQTVATYQGSMDMVTARLGKVFLPALDQASARLQWFAGILDTAAGQAVTRFAGQALKEGIKYTDPVSGGMSWLKLGVTTGMQWGAQMRGTTAEKEAERRREKGGWLGWGQGVMDWMTGEAPPIKKSQVGFPQPQEMTSDQFFMEMFKSGLMQGAQTTEADVRRKQMEEAIGWMKEVAQNTRPKESAIPPFR